LNNNNNNDDNNNNNHGGGGGATTTTTTTANTKGTWQTILVVFDQRTIEVTRNRIDFS
jgi:hypothetical protein